MSKSHPNLIESYFENIDTKEKAYWLGFLYADGNVSHNTTIYIGTHKKDCIIINRFAECIGANKNKIHINSNNNIMMSLYITSKRMFNDLVKHGCVPRKTHVLELPTLNNRNLYLAFLLGFFDGDGTQGKTVIATASKKFLIQIKNKFNLPFKIHEQKAHQGYINNRLRSFKTSYYMFLGGVLFNEMMDNYEHSLPRKRKYFCTEKQRIEKIKESMKLNIKGKLSNLTKEKLEKLIWKIPCTEIGKKYNASSKAIEKKCKKFGISKPPRGYWAKVRSILKSAS